LPLPSAPPPPPPPPVELPTELAALADDVVVRGRQEVVPYIDALLQKHLSCLLHRLEERLLSPAQDASPPKQRSRASEEERLQGAAATAGPPTSRWASQATGEEARYVECNLLESYEVSHSNANSCKVGVFWQGGEDSREMLDTYHQRRLEEAGAGMPVALQSLTRAPDLARRSNGYKGSCRALPPNALRMQAVWNELSDAELQDYYNSSADAARRFRSAASISTVPSKRSSSGSATASFRSGYPASVLHPASRTRNCWNILCVVLLAYDTVMIPLLPFDLPMSKPPLLVFDWISRILWTFDIFITFRTGYYIGTKVEMRPRMIAAAYARSWLAPDLLTVLLDWISGFLAGVQSSGPRVFRFFRILRSARLFRLSKLKHIVDSLEQQINSNSIHLCIALVKWTVAFLVIGHVVTCIWYDIGKSTSKGWTTYEDQAEGPRDFFFWYFAANRWTLAQINGRTDMDDRRNMPERLFTCLVAIALASIFQALFVGSITMSMMELTKLAEDRNNLRRLMNAYFEHQNVPNVLVASVKRHLNDNQSFEERYKKEASLLALVPDRLRQDLLFAARTEVLMGHRLMNQVNELFPRAARQVFGVAMQSSLARSGEELFEQGDQCEHMTIVDSGSLVYTHPGCKLAEVRTEQTVLSRGSWIAEAAIWAVAWRNQGHLFADTNCSLITLEGPALAKALLKHREAYAEAVAYGQAFLKRMQTMDGEQLSDLSMSRR